MEIIHHVHVFENMTIYIYPIRFSDQPITAWKDVWFIGDQFIHDIYHALQKLKTKAVEEQQDVLYIYDM